ncbi:esterase/lipase family protein [Streptomyces coeruleoprunus]|uniref:Esterase/lipase family protein n=1 Tax=Streptomyces coeruleoprunus TaxID=285563 RepID=A0ABV9X8F3_9ACTN
MLSNGTTTAAHGRRGRGHARHRRRLAAAATGLAAALGLGLSSLTADRASASPETAAAGTTEQTGPVQTDFVSAFRYSLTHPTAVPAGANDWSCRPGAAHPHPVVLVHGTFENRYANWAGLAPRLKEAGYCVYALNHGGAEGAPLQGTGDIVASAGQLASFVDRVRAATGAAEVDLVGHSQGGLMPRYYIDRLGGAAKVHRLVSLTSPHHGTTLQGMGLLARAVPGADDLFGASCRACEQQIVASDFLRDLNSGEMAHPAVDHTVVTTVHDQVVTPFTSSYLPPSAHVTNHTVQTYCLTNRSDHTTISYDPVAARLVLNALDPAHARRPGC